MNTCKIFVFEEGFTYLSPFHIRLIREFKKVYGEETIGDSIAFILDDYFYKIQPEIWSRLYKLHFEVEGNEE